MKKLIFSLLFISTAHAEPIGFINNRAGGQIVFTNEVCSDEKRNYEGLLRAFAFSRDGTTLEACYYADAKASLLFVAWKESKEKSVYRIEDITLYK